MSDHRRPSQLLLGPLATHFDFAVAGAFGRSVCGQDVHTFLVLPGRQVIRATANRRFMHRRPTSVFFSSIFCLEDSGPREAGWPRWSDDAEAVDFAGAYCLDALAFQKLRELRLCVVVRLG